MILITLTNIYQLIKLGIIISTKDTCQQKTKVVSEIYQLTMIHYFFLHEFTKNKNDRLFDKLSNNAVNKTIRKITGREVRVHSLRHTFASYLISISQVLDHENLNITLEVYAHQLQEQKDRNDKLNQRNLGRIWGKIALNRYLHAMNMSPAGIYYYCTQ